MQGTIQYSCGCSTGMQHPSAASNVRLFPSIVTREFQLDLSKAQGVYQSARILDSAGRLLDQLELDATATSILRNVASLSPGVYTLQLTGLKSSAQLKFVRAAINRSPKHDVQACRECSGCVRVDTIALPYNGHVSDDQPLSIGENSLF